MTGAQAGETKDGAAGPSLPRWPHQAAARQKVKRQRQTTRLLAVITEIE
ncbi:MULTISPECIES: hypothetical protein [Xanthomonas]|uniref:Uncharacterized protein n=1 Tax=Xanthomonas cucurbitae TaxID=56453 RepID=A0ABY7YE51_9XANT|nr:hypothetical protein [Xanthomonas cucurbitae]WDM68295.1 hypothetical protein K6981_02925 [Xanthomonas cucurbitae]WDM72168.1 hypothetical protein K6978_02925 [Xanthomonas cucurbitae]WDM75961.1 hypothetical protein K6982_02695 [Xanthomonas cucurbitae]WDM78613.1 hypothetical protein K6980_15950 [Xanthomonas cucurbitae]WDM82292.1 hypothetical protein K6979_15945 [Xanthomonas cucurbitae]